MCGSFTIYFSLTWQAQFSMLVVNVNIWKHWIKIVNGFVVFGEKRFATTQTLWNTSTGAYMQVENCDSPLLEW